MKKTDLTIIFLTMFISVLYGQDNKESSRSEFTPVTVPYFEAGATFFTPGGFNLSCGYTMNKKTIRISGGYSGEARGAQLDFVFNIRNILKSRIGGGPSVGYLGGYNINSGTNNPGEARGIYIAGQCQWNIKLFFISAGLGYVVYDPNPDVRLVPLISIGINKRFIKNI